MKLNPTQTVFRAAGLLASAASVWGTYGYILHETNGDLLLSGAAATGLSIAIYAGWDIAFNHHHWKRRALAAVIALAGAGISTATIYQYIKLPDQLKAQTQAESTAQEVKTLATEKKQAALTKAAEDRQAIKDQQAQLTAERQKLEAANLKDQERIDAKQKKVDEGWHPKTNRREIKTIRITMTQRETRIAAIQEQNSHLTTEYRSIKAELPVSPTTALPTTASPTLIIEPATLIRASLYEIMTALFLLFGSFYRRNGDEAEQQTTAELNHAIEAASEKAGKIFQLQDKLTQLINAGMTVGEQLNQQQQESGTAASRYSHELTELTQAAEKLLTEVTAQNQGLRQNLNSATQAQQKLLPATQSAERHQQDLATIIGSADSLLNNLNDATVRCNKTIAAATTAATTPTTAFADTVAPANAAPANATVPATPPANVRPLISSEKLTEEQALTLLKNQEIEASQTGAITTGIIKKATGWGRTLAESLLIRAFESGYLDRKPYGTGWVYFYPEKTNQTEPTQPPVLRAVKA